MGIVDDAGEADLAVLRKRKVKNVVTGPDEVKPLHESGKNQLAAA